MAKRNQRSKQESSTPLRQRAEELLRGRPTDISEMAAEELQVLVHELEVHQIELELQNEELREAQIQLAESRDQYSNLYEFAPVGHVTLDPDGKILNANLTAATLLGVERQHLLRAKISDFVTRECQDECYLHRQSVFSGEAKEICELEMHRSDGTLMVVRLESLAIRAPDNRQCRTAIIDITAARHAQQQLEESQQRYRRLTEAVTDYIYRVRVEHGRAVETIHGANCEAVTGYTPQEFDANPMLWIAMVPPEERAVVEQQASGILSAQGAPPIEHRIRRKDGQIRWVLNTVSPHRDDQHRLIAYDGLLRDITDRKRAEEALRQLNEELEQRVNARTADLRQRTDQLARQSAELQKREHEFRTLANNVPAQFSYVDRDQRYRYVNHRYEELFQRPANEIIDKTVAELLGPQRYEVARPHIEAVLKGDKVSYEAEFDLTDGQHSMHVNYVPDRDARGQVRGFFALVTDITQLKQAEQQLQLFAEAVSHLGEGVMITNDHLDWPGPYIVFVNEAMCRITGYTTEELIGKSPRILQGDDTERATLDRVKTELAANRSSLAEVTNFRKDGAPYNAEMFITPLFNAEGRRTNFVSIHRDITDRKAAEMALREREERLSAVLNTAADAVITIDRRGIINSVNPATERMFGHVHDELIGQNVKILMPPPFHDEHDSYIARYLETGQAHIIGMGREVAGQRKDGSTFPVDLSVSKVDHLGLFTGMIRDISQRKEAQEALRREEEFAENMISTAPIVVLVLDTEGRIVQFNPYLEELAGWQLDKVKGKDWFETFLREEDRILSRKLFNKALAGQRTRGSVNAIFTKVGCEREIEWYDAPLTGEDGHLVGLLCTGHDITERRILEREILDISAEEQRRIGSDLHDGVCQQLTGLGMLAQGFADVLADENASQILEDAGLLHLRDMAKQLSAGIGNATAEARALSHGLIPVDVDAQGLMAALRELSSSIDALDDISCAYEDNCTVELLDNFAAIHLYRIAQEAVGNALKHSQAKQIRVALNEHDGHVILTVRDDGAGFSDVTQLNSGMGLRIMKYRADLIGAALSIEPAKGGGTCVACRWARERGKASGRRIMEPENSI